MLRKPLDAHALRLIDHLVRLSTLRERDTLLHSVTRALIDTVSAVQVETFSLVLDEAQRFWMPLTRCKAGGKVQIVTDQLRADVASLLPLSGNAARARCVEEMKTIVRAPDATQPLWTSVMPVPLSSEAAVWGVIEFTSERELSPTDELAASRLLQVFSNMLDVLDYSECDALTGLWNRKSFDDLFFKTMPAMDLPPPPGVETEHRAIVANPVFWLAMIDIDHFKQVNDRFGHLIGDEVLILVARLLRSSFRSHDRVFRFGGEEFVVVLRCPDHASALAALERFRSEMEAHNFPQAGRITASVGFTQIISGDSPNAACERADQAVYHGKHNGRNQVCSESDLVARGILKSTVKVSDFELF